MRRRTTAQTKANQEIVLTVKPDPTNFVRGVIGSLVRVESVIAKDDPEWIIVLARLRGYRNQKSLRIEWPIGHLGG
jgi:hypothetical protein